MNTKGTGRKITHHGHAIKRIRQSMGLKQEVLAGMIGANQPRVSNHEQKKVLDDELIYKYAKALNVSPDMIRELDDNMVNFSYEKNYFQKCSLASICSIKYINSNSEIINQFIELANEKEALYKRLFEVEKESNQLYDKLLKYKDLI